MAHKKARFRQEQKRAIRKFRLSSEHEPQAELHYSCLVGGTCDLAEAPTVANIAVGRAPDHGVKEVEGFSSELELSSFAHNRESSKDREICVPVPLRVEGIWAKVPKRPERWGLEGVVIEPASLRVHGCTTGATTRIGIA